MDADLAAADRSDRLWSVVAGLFLVLTAVVVYTAFQTPSVHNHFVWQALAFLDGRAEIDYPVGQTLDSLGNWFFQDVMPVGDDRALIPFPPLPAVILTPFVATWGLATDVQRLAAIFAAIAVGAAFWALGGLPIRRWIRVWATVFFAFGTVFWYAANVGTTWFLAHVIAVGLALGAVGLALRADPAAAEDEPWPEEEGGAGARAGEPATIPEAIRAVLRSPLGMVDGRQFVAGLLFGLAATARLPVIFAAPFFVLVGSGGSWPRRAWSAGLGAVIPIAILLGYNLVSTGHLFHPAYEYQYLLEAYGYPTLGYRPDWSIEDPRYIVGNLEIMLLTLPAFLPDVVPAALGGGARLCVEPDAVRGLFDADCPIAMPRDIGMSLLLVSPAYLLALPLLRSWGRSRLVSGAVLAVGLIAVVNLMHFSQGWVQFGYRFSNDFVPFALPLVALGLAAATRSRAGAILAGALIAVSILVNAWGVAWGSILEW